MQVRASAQGTWLNLDPAHTLIVAKRARATVRTPGAGGRPTRAQCPSRRRLELHLSWSAGATVRLDEDGNILRVRGYPGN